jgi:DNA-binding XRE family transcriptional regulator
MILRRGGPVPALGTTPRPARIVYRCLTSCSAGATSATGLTVMYFTSLPASSPRLRCQGREERGSTTTILRFADGALAGRPPPGSARVPGDRLIARRAFAPSLCSSPPARPRTAASVALPYFSFTMRSIGTTESTDAIFIPRSPLRSSARAGCRGVKGHGKRFLSAGFNKRGIPMIAAATPITVALRLRIRSGRTGSKTCILNQCAPNQYALDRCAGNGDATSVADPRQDQDRKQASSAFGKRLRELRDRQELSQDGLADATDIHPTAIGRMERGAREPRLTTILRLADGLDVQPGELLNDLEKASKMPKSGL